MCPWEDEGEAEAERLLMHIAENISPTNATSYSVRHKDHSYAPRFASLNLPANRSYVNTHP